MATHPRWLGLGAVLGLAAGVTLGIPTAEVISRGMEKEAAAPGTRVLLDAHNAYPHEDRWADRIDRALATGLPVAIEQDLVWRPATSVTPARSIVSHGEPFTGREPALREHFFERVRPLVTRALAAGNKGDWPLIVLNLDFKTNEPEHHLAIWNLLGEYEAWLTTAERTPDGALPAPLAVGPVLVLTGDNDAQQSSFHDQVPAGRSLRLFGAVAVGQKRWARAHGLADLPRERQAAEYWNALPGLALRRASNYRRWWNNPWSVVEQGGQGRAAAWTEQDEARLRRLVRNAHDAGLWVRFYTLNGHAADDAERLGVSKGYNFGSLDQARRRWRAAIAAGVDFVAVDQYEEFAAELAAMRGQPRR